jgi:gliding motility-associated protein GldE
MQVFFINVVLITFVLLVFGEVVPKVYAARKPLQLLKITAPILDLINTFLIKIRFTPLLVKSTNLFKVEQKIHAHNITMDDLQHALDLTSKTHSEPEDKKILEGVVKFGNTDVKQIMTPRVQSVLIEMSTPFAEIIKVIKETHFSRIPIYSESIDQVKGVLYAKDLLPYLDREVMDWERLMRTPFFVPENKKIDDLLKEFQNKKTHLAIVVDEYGGVSGLVTLEDVIEEIVGDITDEFDDDDLFFSKVSDDCFIFEGQTSLINMYRALGVRGEEFESHKGEADSVAGFILEVAGRIPLKGESINFNNCTFTIESADRRRIKSVKIEVNRQEDES